ncbi:MAG TPA: metallophosphoesterase [Propionibacteriaceae bacterium]|nr:metallophosphoesterase [Propionibacteriaceae bacterium]
MRHVLGVVAVLITLVLVACGSGGPAEPAEPPAPATRAESQVPATPAESKVPATPAGPAVRFTAAGDFGSNEKADAVLKTIKSLNSDLTLALGDLSYGRPGAEKQWCDYVTDRLGEGYPFEVLAGNHESDGRNGNIDAFASCLPNELPNLVGSYGTQYYVDVPAKDPLVRFVMISPGLRFPDGTWEYRKGSARYEWTARAIDAAREKAIPWVVVGMHKPCLSVGRYSCDSGSDLFNLLLTKRVDLILGGHDHSYQRTKQLRLSDGCKAIAIRSFDEDCVADEDGELVRGAGSVSVVAATGGRGQYDVSGSDSEANYFASVAGGNRNETYGALDVMVTETKLQASFVPAAGGTHTDTFSIHASR